MTPDYLQWGGCATGVLGSLLLASRCRWSGWGFVVYLVSNAFWIAFGLAVHVPGLVAMQLVFVATSLVGVWRWLVAPARPRHERVRVEGSGLRTVGVRASGGKALGGLVHGVDESHAPGTTSKNR